MFGTSSVPIRPNLAQEEREGVREYGRIESITVSGEGVRFFAEISTWKMAQKSRFPRRGWLAK